MNLSVLPSVQSYKLFSLLVMFFCLEGRRQILMRTKTPGALCFLAGRFELGKVHAGRQRQVGASGGGKRRGVYLINPPRLFYFFFFASNVRGQTHQPEESASGVCRRSVYTTTKVSYKLCRLQKAPPLPPQKVAHPPTELLCNAKEETKRHCCNNCEYYIIIPFWILGVHVLLKARAVLLLCIRLNPPIKICGPETFFGGGGG